jgi:hypothetical protein
MSRVQIAGTVAGFITPVITQLLRKVVKANEFLAVLLALGVSLAVAAAILGATGAFTPGGMGQAGLEALGLATILYRALKTAVEPAG